MSPPEIIPSPLSQRQGKLATCPDSRPQTAATFVLSCVVSHVLGQWRYDCTGCAFYLQMFHQKLASCSDPSLWRPRQTRKLNFWSFMCLLRCLGSKEVNSHWLNVPFLHQCVSSNVSSKLATSPKLSLPGPLQTRNPNL